LVNVVKPILIVWLASAGTNEMRHREFSKSQSTSSVKGELRNFGSSPLASKDGV
jgi:hypothetical protein